MNKTPPLTIKIGLGTIFFLPVLSACHSVATVSSLELAQTSSEPSTPEEIAEAITVPVSHNNQSGSGILIHQEGDSYQVLTNAHLTTEEETTYQIETPDGETYQATQESRGDSFEGQDLALLTFESEKDYLVAELGNVQTLNPEDPVFVAGYPNATQELVYREGEITLLPEKALKGGYRIGYSNEIEPGMSGGPLLNEQGELIGVNGLAQGAILDAAYTFEDGSAVEEGQLDKFRDASWSVPLEISSLASIHPELAQSEIKEVANAITVRIETEQGNGSGVIIAEEEDTYTVLTADHVVAKEQEYEVITPDGESHGVDYETVRSPEGIDIAVLEFDSAEDYTVATLANYPMGFITSGGQKEVPLTFLSGFPGESSGHRSPQKQDLTTGYLQPTGSGGANLAVNNVSSLSNGYGLVYTNLSYRGMSGGPLLDYWGRVVGINAASEAEFEISSAGEVVEVNLGYSLGVPIRTFLGRAGDLEVPEESFTLETSSPPFFDVGGSKLWPLIDSLVTVEKPSSEASALEWLNYGNQLWRTGSPDKAVEALNQAIERRSDLEQAYYAKGKVLNQIAFNPKEGENPRDFYERALAAHQKATELNPNFYEAWREQGEILAELGQPKKALDAFEQALAINPDDFLTYWHQGDTLLELGRFEKAQQAYRQWVEIKPSAFAYLSLFQSIIAPVIQSGTVVGEPEQLKEGLAYLQKAIEIDPNFLPAYELRSITFAAVGLNEQALADINKVLELQPDNPAAYLHRGQVYSFLDNYQQAIKDYDKALNLGYRDPALVHDSRANAYQNLENYEQALTDYSRAIELEPNNGDYYKNRASLYQTIGRHQKAVADYTQALTLYTQTLAGEGEASNVAITYFGRAFSNAKLGNTQQAVADYQKAKKLFEKMGNTRGAELAQQGLEKVKSGQL